MVSLGEGCNGWAVRSAFVFCLQGGVLGCLAPELWDYGYGWRWDSFFLLFFFFLLNHGHRGEMSQEENEKLCVFAQLAENEIFHAAMLFEMHR